MSGFISGARLERISVADYTAYDAASTGRNWRVPAGYGTLISGSLPPTVALRLSTPWGAIDLNARGVTVATSVGTVHARAAILTVSTAVLGGESIRLPAAPRRLAARRYSAAARAEREVIPGDHRGQPVRPGDAGAGNPRDMLSGALPYSSAWTAGDRVPRRRWRTDGGEEWSGGCFRLCHRPACRVVRGRCATEAAPARRLKLEPDDARGWRVQLCTAGTCGCPPSACASFRAAPVFRR